MFLLYIFIKKICEHNKCISISDPIFIDFFNSPLKCVLLSFLDDSKNGQCQKQNSNCAANQGPLNAAVHVHVFTHFASEVGSEG